MDEQCGESDNDLPLFMSRLKTVMKKRRNQNEVPG